MDPPEHSLAQSSGRHAATDAVQLDGSLCAASFGDWHRAHSDTDSGISQYW